MTRTLKTLRRWSPAIVLALVLAVAGTLLVRRAQALPLTLGATIILPSGRVITGASSLEIRAGEKPAITFYVIGQGRVEIYDCGATIIH